MAEPVLRARGLEYAYPGASAPALRDVTLAVEAGEFVVLAGRSGSGKSTLLRAFCGLVPHFHGGTVDGELEVAGLDVSAHGPAELAAVAGLVSQEPETQVVSTTVRAELELPLELRGQPPAARARAVEEVALSLAIDDLLDRTTDTLSGGELQRVALAASLVTRPRVVLLDEPTSQLDPVAGDELIGLLRRLNEEWGVAVVLGEHRLERCLAAADRVLALEQGRIAFDGAPVRFLAWALEADPVLATPGARLFATVGLPPRASVREARAELAERGHETPEPAAGQDEPAPAPSRRSRRAERPVLRARNLWLELGEGEQRTEVLRGLDLEVRAGERVALMGGNGAGKTSLLRVAASLADSDRGTVEAPQGVALLPQRPGDLFAHETVAEELGEESQASLRRFGLQGLAGADPRDMSGGERQRLALAIVTAGRAPGSSELPGALLLDEPTRGMDRARKQDLAELIEGWSASGAAVLVATHDVEFAASFADRVVLMGRGEIVADAGPSELLAGGWYFSSEVARILEGGAVTVEDGAELLRAGIGANRSSTAVGREP